MWKDPIVEEVRKAREEYAARFNHDLRAMAIDLRRREKEGGRQIITLQPQAAKEGAVEGVEEIEP